MTDSQDAAVGRQDAAALVGLLAVLEGELVSDQLASPTVQQICHRFERDGLLATASGAGQLRLALAALNQRLRYALGEFNGPIEPPQARAISTSDSLPDPPPMTSSRRHWGMGSGLPNHRCTTNMDTTNRCPGRWSSARPSCR